MTTPHDLGAGMALVVGRQDVGRSIACNLGDAWNVEVEHNPRGVHVQFNARQVWDLIVVDADSPSFGEFANLDAGNKIHPVVLGLLESLHRHLWHVPIVVLTDDLDPERKEDLERRHVQAVMSTTETAHDHFRKRVAELLQFSVLVALPTTPSAELLNAISTLNTSSDYLVIEEVEEARRERIVEQCRIALNHSRDALEGVGEAFWSDPRTKAAMVVTGWEEDPRITHQILFYGMAGRSTVTCIPSNSFKIATEGFPESARVLYSAAQAALISGAGLQFHRRVEGCPLDFCVDKLDVPRGMTTGRLCKDCETRLAGVSDTEACRLTPLQMESLKKLLIHVKEICGCTDGAPAGVVLPQNAQSAGPVCPDLREEEDDTFLANLAGVANLVSRHYDEYSARERILRDEDSLFFPIRHYNSNTPMIPGERGAAQRSNIYSPAHYVGGGYFLAHGGFGIVVDPGYNFLHQLYNIQSHQVKNNSATPYADGYTVEDIDLVIVTHNHWDHHADLETILRSRRSRKLQIYCPIQVVKLYEMSSRCRHSDFHVRCLERPTDWTKVLELSPDLSRVLEIRQLPALHWQHTDFLALDEGNVEERLRQHLDCFGLHFTLKGSRTTGATPLLRRLLITGDTLCPVLSVNDDRILPQSFEPYLGAKHWSRLLMRRGDWTDSIVDRLKEAYETFCRVYAKQSADVVCAHIGTLERKGWDHNHNLATLHYGGLHLGLLGCLRLLSMMQSPPSLVLLSEFGEELIGHRVHLCQSLSKLWRKYDPRVLSNEYNVLPADTSLCIDLHEGSIRCSRCSAWHKSSEVRAIERGTDIISYVLAQAAKSPTSICEWKD